jgi:hypothetical protein
MAPHCVRTIRPTRRTTPDVQPETGKRSTGFGECRTTTAEPRQRTITRLACNQIDEEPKIWGRDDGGRRKTLPREIPAVQEGVAKPAQILIS